MRIRLILFLFMAGGAIAQPEGATSSDWPHYGGTQFTWRYSALDQINTTNVKALTPAWLFQTGDYSGNLQATPIVVGGVLYLITARANIFALDAATGRQIWHYTYPEPATVRGTGYRGLAVGGGKVIFGTRDDFVVALDQATGRMVWKVSMDDPAQCSCGINAAPLIAGDKVIVGATGGDSANRGYLTALRIKDGHLAWRWYVIPGPGETGHDTWKGESWKYGGGSPWVTGSFDPELNLIYWGTGNAAADFYDGDRLPAGAKKNQDVNLYTASVVALDANSGKLRWHYQEIHDDTWDWDSVYEVMLVDLRIGAQTHKALIHMNKSGLTVVLDRLDGSLLQHFYVPEVQTWMDGITEDGKIIGRHEPVVGKSILICPSVDGAKSWNSMAYSPRTGLVYVPANEVCSTLTSADRQVEEGRNYMDGSFRFELPPGRTTYSHIDAWNPVTGKRVWSVPYKYVLLASMLATSGDLVFTGNPEGDFFALDARNGEKLWSYQTGAGHRGSSIAYSVNGREYIATSTGWQTSVAGAHAQSLFPDQEWRGGSTLVVFALPDVK